MNDWRVWIGLAAAACSTALFVVGFGAQIRYNRERRSTEGLHPLLVHLSPLSLLLWVIWSTVYRQTSPLITNLIGVFFALIILWQYYHYPREENKK